MNRGMRVRPRRPTPTISIEDAVAYVCWQAESLMRHVDGASSSTSLLEDDCKHGGQLQDAIRDCGWCIYFQYGETGLDNLADAIVGAMDKSERYEVKHVIEHSLSGIGKWLAHGDY